MRGAGTNAHPLGVHLSRRLVSAAKAQNEKHGWNYTLADSEMNREPLQVS